MKQILDFASCEKVNTKNIKAFSALVFKAEGLRYNLTSNVMMKVQLLLYGANGYVRSINVKGRQKITVVVNNRTFLQARKNTSSIVIWLYVYATIVHELEHILLSRQLVSRNVIEFKRFIAALHQYNRYSWTQDDSIFRGIIPIPDYTKMRNRMASLPELICTLVGLKRAYYVLGDLLEAKEKEAINTMIASLDFLYNHMEISYRTSAQPYNQFAQNIISIHKKVRKDVAVLDQLKQLRNVFDPTGVIFSPMKMYQDRTVENAEYYDSLLIRLFLVYDMNWECLFSKNTEFFRYMEKLANEYCMRTVYYLKNIQIGEVFLNADVLQDNAAMLIRNTQRLNVLMKRFGMNHTAGSVFSLYN